MTPAQRHRTAFATLYAAQARQLADVVELAAANEPAIFAAIKPALRRHNRSASKVIAAFERAIAWTEFAEGHDLGDA